MPLFPPGPAVGIVVDGHRVAAYRRAYLADGRIFATVAPLFTEVADRIWWDGPTLVIQRGRREARIRLSRASAEALDAQYLPAAPVLRELGAAVRYDPQTRRLFVTVAPQSAVASPAPFDPAAPQAPTREVFTPAPPVTPRPAWTGSPLPRRTALPFPPR